MEPGTLWSEGRDRTNCANHTHPIIALTSSYLFQRQYFKIVSLAPNFLCLLAGSCDSCIKLWQCSDGFKELMPLFSIPVVTIIFNQLVFSLCFFNKKNLTYGLHMAWQSGAKRPKLTLINF